MSRSSRSSGPGTVAASVGTVAVATYGAAFTVQTALKFAGAPRSLQQLQPPAATELARQAGSSPSSAGTPSALTVAAFATLGAAGLGAAAKRAQRAASRRTTASGRGRRVEVRAAGEAVNPDDFLDVCDKTGVTLNRYMIEMTKRGIVDEDIQSVFNSIREATKVISKLVKQAPLSQAELLGLQGEINVQGEDQKKLDVITNDVLKKALQYSGKLGTLASEEEDSPVLGSFETRGDDGQVISRGETLVADTGKYVCVFDPLDGSSNVDAGIAVGTIFGIFEEPDLEACNLPEDIKDMDATQMACLASTLQPGKALVAAGYVLYSCSTEMVFTTGNGCIGFTLDESIGEYVLTRPSIQIPPRGKIYSMNEANVEEWDEPMKRYVEDIQTGKGETGTQYSLRYIGSMVGDVHRTLLYGGIFAYPADSKNKDGKLRLLYEAAPMSFILEQAGGKAITGFSRVMDIPPAAVHQRVPVILGSKDDVEECQKYFEASKDEALRKRCESRLQVPA